MKIKIFLVTTLYLLSISTSHAYSNRDSLINNIIVEFKKVARQNKINSLEGHPEDNQYVFNIDYGTGMISSDCSMVQWRWYAEDSEGEIDIQIQQPEGYDMICEDYNAFNNVNPSNIQAYIFYITFPNVILESSLLADQQNSSTPVDHYHNNKGTQDIEDYNDLIETLKEKLGEVPVGTFAEGKERLFMAIGQYQVITNREKDFKATLRYDYKTSDFLTSNKVSDYFVNTWSGFDSSNKFNLKDFLQKTMDYWNGNLNPDIPCSDLAETFEEGSTAHDFMDAWCDNLSNTTDYPWLNNEYIQEIIYPFAQHVDAVTTNTNGDNSVDADAMVFTPQQYYDLLLSEYVPGTGYYDYIGKLFAELEDVCGTDLSDLEKKSAYELVRLQDQSYYNSLSIEKLLCLVKIYNTVSSDVNNILWAEVYVDEKDFFQKIFKAVQSKNDQQLAADFLTGEGGIIHIDGATQALWNAVTNLAVGQDQEFPLLKIINEVAALAAGHWDGNSYSIDFENYAASKIIPWEPGPNDPIRIEAPKEDEFTKTGYDQTDGYESIKVNMNYCSEIGLDFWSPNEFIQGHGPYGTVYAAIGWEKECKKWEIPTSTGFISAYDIIFLTNFQKTLFAPAGNQLDNKALPISAFALAWLIQQDKEKDLFEVGLNVTLAIVTILTLPASGTLGAIGLTGRIVLFALRGAILYNAVFSLLPESEFQDVVADYIGLERATELWGNLSDVSEVVSWLELGEDQLLEKLPKLAKMAASVNYIRKTKKLKTGSPEWDEDSDIEKTAGAIESLHQTAISQNNNGYKELVDDEFKALYNNYSGIVDYEDLPSEIFDLMQVLDFISPSKRADIINWLASFPEDKMTKLAADLIANNSALMKKFRNSADDFDNLEYLKSWETVFLKHSGPNVRRTADVKLLDKVYEVRKDQDVFDALGGEEGLATIIEKNPAAPCCGDAAHNYLKNIDEYVDDVKKFTKEFGPPDAIPGFDGVITTMKSGNIWMTESVAQMLKKISLEPDVFKKTNVQSIDLSFITLGNDVNGLDDLSCPNCKFDIAMINGDKYEFKSYINSTIDAIPSSSQFRQQNRAYLESVTDVDQLNYIFEAGKISTPTGVFVNGVELSAEQLARYRLLQMYQNNAAYFWTPNTENFWMDIFNGIENEDDLLDELLASTYDSDWLDFIKAE